MNIGGKIGTWLCVVCACVALYFTVWAIKARSGWIKQLDEKTKQYEQLVDEEPALRHKVEQLTAEVDTLELPWGQFADAQVNPQTGVNGTGDQATITLKLPEQRILNVAPGAKVHLFTTDAGGNSAYAGRFRVDSATPQGVVVVRPDFKVRPDVNWMVVQPTDTVKTFATGTLNVAVPAGATNEAAQSAIQPAMQAALQEGKVPGPVFIDAYRASDSSLWRSPGQWRVRNRIPTGYDEEFLNLRTDITRVDERRARTSNFLVTQKSRVQSADEALQFQRNILLSGTEAQDAEDLLPQEVVEGLVKAIRDEESKRNAALAELDQLRHKLYQAMTRYQRLRSGNQDLAQQLPGGKDSPKETASLAPQPSAP